MGAQRQPRDDPKRPAAAALERPEQVGIDSGVGQLDFAIGGDHLRLQEARRGRAEPFGVAAEAAALDQTRHAHRRTAAALHIAAAFGGDGVVRLKPNRAGPDADRGLGLDLSGATLRDEIFVKFDRPHGLGPDQQGVRRVGAAQIAVAPTLHDEAQIMRSREDHRSGDIGRGLGCDRVFAWPRRPGIGPAEGLGQRDVVADEEWIAQVLEEGVACIAVRSLDAVRQG